MKMLDLVGLDVQFLALPDIGRQAGLQAEPGEKVILMRKLVPDLGQEGSTAKTLADNDAVHLRSEFGKQIVAVFVGTRLRLGKNAYLNSDALIFIRGQRPETLVVKGGADGIFFTPSRTASVPVRLPMQPRN